jgi:hypothetical protein
MCVKDIIAKIKSLFLKDLRAERGRGYPVVTLVPTRLSMLDGSEDPSLHEPR